MTIACVGFPPPDPYTVSCRLVRLLGVPIRQSMCLKGRAEEVLDLPARHPKARCSRVKWMAAGAPCQLNTHTLPPRRLSKKWAECDEMLMGRRGNPGVSLAKQADENTVAVRISETNLSIANFSRLT